MEGFMRGVSNNLLLRHYRSNCIYQGESVTAQVAGRNSGFAHNPHCTFPNGTPGNAGRAV
jgi:hypothetical protein